jgi:glucose/arabinose dehydrogenase/PKD repeat protein
MAQGRYRYAPAMRLLCFGLLLLAGILLGKTHSVAASPPANFQNTPIVTSGLDGPSGFEVAPDGRIFILERTGKVKIFKNGQLLSAPFADLPSVASGDRGMIGIAFDPDYGVSNNYVYFYYTGLDLLNHLVRFDASGDVGTDGPYTIFQTQSPSQWLHVGGSIRFGPDNKMYFAVGDNGYPPNAQDLSNPHGKILRINKDGTIPTDNPFYGQPGKLGAIWAYGLRNPWRFQFDSATGRLYGGDVGDYTWEEVNLLTKGGNYGWPNHEGMCTTNCQGYTNPLYAYIHNDLGGAITAGPVYHGSQFPAEYQNAFFFGDYTQMFIKYMKLNPDGTSAGVFDFDPAAGSVVDLKTAADGSLYYLTYYPGGLYKISYNTTNTTPKASASADVTKGAQPLTVHFSSAGTSDPAGKPLTYSWDFGDGTSSTAANPAKTYANKGVFTVRMTVSNGTSQAAALPIVIQVGIPPTLTIVTPHEGDMYNAGDSFTYNVFASDAAGFDINDANLRTDVILHHNTHTHPFQSGLQGRVGTFTIPTTGEASADTWYEMKVTATDTSGLSTTKSVNILPHKVNISYATVPSGLQVLLDGVPNTTPETRQGVAGFQRELAAPPIQTDANGTVYEFTGWADNTPIRHVFTTPATDVTYTANYQPSAPFKGEYFDNQNLTGTPKLVRNDPQVNFVWGQEAPDPAIPADHFSVRWTKNQSFTAGRYVFTTATDDGVRLYIDNKLVIDKWFDQSGAAYTYTADLSAGTHLIKLEYYDATVDATAKLTWDTAATQPSSAYTAQYWNVPGTGTAPSIPTTQPTLSRQETAIDYDWGEAAPAPGVNADHFVARWTKSLTLNAGVYTFTATADDGIRVYVDGVRILDKWVDEGPTTYTITQAMSEGPHAIVVEYYENAAGAVAKFSYAKTADLPPPADWQAEYWNTPGTGTAPSLPARAADLTQTDAAINHDWGAGSPGTPIAADHFAARYTRTDNLPSGIYTLSGWSDDGVRVYVDDQLVLDKWRDQNEAFTVDKILSSGNHTFRIEYYENVAGAILKFDYQKTGEVPPPPTFKGEYFDNQTLSGAPKVIRQDDAINFDWGIGAPDVALPVDHFSARWTKTETLPGGVYTFHVTADDGVRVYVDGVNILDKWVDEPPTDYTITRPLADGTHVIAMEYYENAAGAIARLSYSKTAELPPPPGFAASYFANMTLAGTPVLTREDAHIDFDWGAGSPGAGVPADQFSARWTKTEDLASGTYRLSITGDDGIRLYVDNTLVLDGWGDHGPTTYTVDRALTAGPHTWKIEYYEHGGGAIARFSALKL